MVKNLIIQRKWTPLHRAAYQGFESIAKFLLSKGANMYSEDHVSYICVCTNC